MGRNLIHLIHLSPFSRISRGGRDTRRARVDTNDTILHIKKNLIVFWKSTVIVKDKKRRDGRDNRITEEGVDRKLLSFA